MQPLDLRGVELLIGDTVAFTAMSRRSAHLRVGKIVELDGAKCRVFNEYANRRDWYPARLLVRVS